MTTGYAPKMINGQMHVWRQDWGWTQAKMGKDLKSGDVLICNYGYGEEIAGIAKETPKTITFDTTFNGKRYQRRINKSTYWAVKDL